METLTITNIRNLSPCYDPSRYLKEDWTGTIITFLQIDDIPAKDRLWVALRPYFIPSPILKTFALNAAKHIKHLMKDKRSLKALDVSEDYLNGTADIETLKTVYAAAYKVAFTAAMFRDDADADTNAYAASAAAYAVAAVAYDDYDAGATYAAYNVAEAVASVYTANAADADVIRLYHIKMLICLLNNK